MSLDKPRIPTQEDVDSKAPIASPTFTGTVAIPNYADVETTLDGIGTNTTAIALKSPIASPTFTGTIAIPNYADVETTLDGIGTNANAITLKAPIASPTFTGTVNAGDMTLSTINFIRPNITGITASTNQTQGQGALTATFNEITTVVNTNDTVTLPSALAGLEVFIDNKGVNTIQIFPASGDDLGNGVDISTTLEFNSSIKFFTYDTTNWDIESETEIFHAEVHDEDNTDDYVINAITEVHSYHSNGIVAGDLAGWTFDIGGGGTSFPIASIADAGGGDITVTTTGTHGLAIGDIISQTNLSDTSYVGIFIILTVPTTTTYTVTAVFTATGTGTMDQASTLDIQDIAIGSYFISWSASATTANNNDTLEFSICKNDIPVVGTKARNKFGTGADFTVLTGQGLVQLVSGDKLSLGVENLSGSGNTTIRNFSMIPIRL